MKTSLYERLVATPGVTRLAGALVNEQMKNERVATRFADSDLPRMKHLAAT